VLRELVETKGARGQFWDFHELIREIKSSYDPETKTTELQVLEPVVEADVLLPTTSGLEDDGRMNDTLFYILNTRYMAAEADDHHPRTTRTSRARGVAAGPLRRREFLVERIRPAPALPAHGDVPRGAPAGQRPPPGAQQANQVALRRP